MITIKKGSMKLEISNNDSFMALQDTSDGMYFKLKDGTEIRFTIPVTAQIKAIPNMIMKAKAQNIEINLDAENMISFS